MGGSHRSADPQECRRGSLARGHQASTGAAAARGAAAVTLSCLCASHAPPPLPAGAPDSAATDGGDRWPVGSISHLPESPFGLEMLVRALPFARALQLLLPLGDRLAVGTGYWDTHVPGSGSGFTFSAKPVSGYGQRLCQPLLQRPHHVRPLRAITSPPMSHLTVG